MKEGGIFYPLYIFRNVSLVGEVILFNPLQSNQES